MLVIFEDFKQNFSFSLERIEADDKTISDTCKYLFYDHVVYASSSFDYQRERVELRWGLLKHLIVSNIIATYQFIYEF